MISFASSMKRKVSLKGEVKILGVGRQCFQASLADEMVELFGNIEKLGGKERFKGLKRTENDFSQLLKAILALFRRLGR